MHAYVCVHVVMVFLTINVHTYYLCTFVYVQFSQHTLCDYVHMMGGSIRKEITSSVTHVVAHSVSGSKYKMAVGFGTPIMSEQWVTKAWESKDTV